MAAVVGELQAQLDDQVTDRAGGGRVGVRSPGLGVDGIEPTGFVSGEQAVQVLSGVAVCRGGIHDRQFTGDDLQDSDPGSGHGRHCRLCRDSGVAYQVSPMS